MLLITSVHWVFGWFALSVSSQSMQRLPFADSAVDFFGYFVTNFVDLCIASKCFLK